MSSCMCSACLSSDERVGLSERQDPVSYAVPACLSSDERVGLSERQDPISFAVIWMHCAAGRRWAK